MKIPHWLPGVVSVVAAIGMLLHGPIAQYPNYHDFADKRALWGVPNALDVLSNIPFLAVGIWGLWALRGEGWRRLGAAKPGFAMLAWGLILTAFGSSFYHLAPDNFRLVFDRIPIALSAAGLIAGVRAATVAPMQPARVPLALGAVGVASVLWWYASDRTSVGDLRPYLFVQFAPVVLVPLWQLIAGDSMRNRIAFALAIVLYAGAKVCEVEDPAIFGNTAFISGHTVKHLLAGAASAALMSLALRPKMPA
jgi:predicted membrane channel-forming protein YqfA (hemolysin III family)